MGLTPANSSAFHKTSLSIRGAEPENTWAAEVSIKCVHKAEVSIPFIAHRVLGPGLMTQK